MLKTLQIRSSWPSESIHQETSFRADPKAGRKHVTEPARPERGQGIRGFVPGITLVAPESWWSKTPERSKRPQQP